MVQLQVYVLYIIVQYCTFMCVRSMFRHMYTYGLQYLFRSFVDQVCLPISNPPTSELNVVVWGHQLLGDELGRAHFSSRGFIHSKIDFDLS